MQWSEWVKRERNHGIRLIIMEQEPILCIIVNSVLQKNLRIRDEVYEIDTTFQVWSDSRA